MNIKVHSVQTRYVGPDLYCTFFLCVQHVNPCKYKDTQLNLFCDVRMCPVKTLHN